MVFKNYGVLLFFITNTFFISLELLKFTIQFLIQTEFCAGIAKNLMFFRKTAYPSIKTKICIFIIL